MHSQRQASHQCPIVWGRGCHARCPDPSSPRRCPLGPGTREAWFPSVYASAETVHDEWGPGVSTCASLSMSELGTDAGSSGAMEARGGPDFRNALAKHMLRMAGRETRGSMFDSELRRALD